MKLKWLKFFESQQKDGDDGETEDLFLKDKVTLFLMTFGQQSLRYQIVWAMRILCWILVLAVGVYGLLARAITYFK